MKAIIPAAGYATRLYPLTRDTPKALLEVKGKPILEHILSKIREVKAIDEVLIVTNARFYENFDYWLEEFQEKHRDFGVKIKIINDHTQSNEDRLGTMGDLQYVFDEEKLDEDFMVVNGDNLFNFSLNVPYELFESQRKASQGKVCAGKPLVGLYGGLSKAEVAGKFGVVELNGSNLVKGFEEKPLEPKSNLISTGIYFFPKAAIGLIGQFLAEGGKADAPGYFLEWLHTREQVMGFVFKDKWFDIGSFEQLGKAREEFNGG